MLFRDMGKKVFRFIKRVYRQSIGCEQILHRSKDGWIIVDQTDFSRFVGIIHAAWLFESPPAAGRRKKKRAPRSGAVSALIVQPGISLMQRTMVNPRPIPVCLGEMQSSDP